MFWLVFLGALIVVLWMAKWAGIIYGITSSLFSGGHNDCSDWRCPHGYDDFGCQPACPLYEHCWGPREKR